MDGWFHVLNVRSLNWRKLRNLIWLNDFSHGVGGNKHSSNSGGELGGRGGHLVTVQDGDLVSFLVGSGPSSACIGVRAGSSFPGHGLIILVSVGDWEVSAWQFTLNWLPLWVLGLGVLPFGIDGIEVGFTVSGGIAKSDFRLFLGWGNTEEGKSCEFHTF